MSSAVLSNLRTRLSGGPESSRIAAIGCPTIFINHVPVPRPPPTVGTDIAFGVDVSTPVPDSVTTAIRRERIVNTVRIGTGDAATDTRFMEFFPPPVPPPQFLQRPPTQVNYEPIARTSGCRQRTWDTS
jgi:hypothetical protein